MFGFLPPPFFIYIIIIFIYYIFYYFFFLLAIIIISIIILKKKNLLLLYISSFSSVFDLVMKKNQQQVHLPRCIRCLLSRRNLLAKTRTPSPPCAVMPPKKKAKTAGGRRTKRALGGKGSAEEPGRCWKIKTVLALTILAKRCTLRYGNWSNSLDAAESIKCCPAYRLR